MTIAVEQIQKPRPSTAPLLVSRTGSCPTRRMAPDVTLLLLIDQNPKRKRRVHGRVGDEAEVRYVLSQTPARRPTRHARSALWASFDTSIRTMRFISRDPRRRLNPTLASSRIRIGRPSPPRGVGGDSAVRIGPGQLNGLQLIVATPTGRRRGLRAPSGGSTELPPKQRRARFRAERLLIAKSAPSDGPSACKLVANDPARADAPTEVELAPASDDQQPRRGPWGSLPLRRRPKNHPGRPCPDQGFPFVLISGRSSSRDSATAWATLRQSRSTVS